MPSRLRVLTAAGPQDPAVGVIRRPATLRQYAAVRLSRVPDVADVPPAERADLTRAWRLSLCSLG